MSSLRLFTVLVVAALAGCSAQQEPGPSTAARAKRFALLGEKAPDFTLEQLQGGTFTLSQDQGKVVLLDFWATWCPPCRISVPELRRLHEHYEGKNVDIVSISLDDSKNAPIDFVREAKIRHRQLMANEDVARAYAVRGIPMFVAIGKDGRIGKIWTGYQPGIENEWRAEIDRLLNS